MEKKSAEKLYVTSLHSSFLSSYVYDTEEKIKLVTDDNLVSASELHVIWSRARRP